MRILISTMEVKYVLKEGVQRPYEVKCGILAGMEHISDRFVWKVQHFKKHFIRRARLLDVK